MENEYLQPTFANVVFEGTQNILPLRHQPLNAQLQALGLNFARLYYNPYGTLYKAL